MIHYCKKCDSELMRKEIDTCFKCRQEEHEVDAIERNKLLQFNLWKRKKVEASAKRIKQLFERKSAYESLCDIGNNSEVQAMYGVENKIWKIENSIFYEDYMKTNDLLDKELKNVFLFLPYTKN